VICVSLYSNYKEMPTCLHRIRPLQNLSGRNLWPGVTENSVIDKAIYKYYVFILVSYILCPQEL